MWERKKEEGRDCNWESHSGCHGLWEEISITFKPGTRLNSIFVWEKRQPRKKMDMCSQTLNRYLGHSWDACVPYVQEQAFRKLYIACVVKVYVISRCLLHNWEWKLNLFLWQNGFHGFLWQLFHVLCIEGFNIGHKLPRLSAMLFE